MQEAVELQAARSLLHLYALIVGNVVTTLMKKAGEFPAGTFAGKTERADALFTKRGLGASLLT